MNLLINDDDDDISAPSVWLESRGSQADRVVDRMQPLRVPCWDRPSQLWALHHLWQPTCMKRRLLVKRK